MTTTLMAWYMCPRYHPKCEAAINNQIKLEIHTSYVYESMASYFNSNQVALKHFSPFFLQQSIQEMDHAQRMIHLQNQRGGRLSLGDIGKPDSNCWKNGLHAMECAFHLKMRVNQSLVDLHQLAIEMRDANLCDFLKSDYMFQQMKFIKELEGHIASLHQMETVESDLVEDLCAKLTLGDSHKN